MNKTKCVVTFLMGRREYLRKSGSRIGRQCPLSLVVTTAASEVSFVGGMVAGPELWEAARWCLQQAGDGRGRVAEAR
jgi:hypothetical protein